MGKLKLNYECAENGALAVEKYSRNPTAAVLILMDVSMPVKNGLQATEEIRAFEKKMGLKRCHIVALTGVTSADARRNAFASGVDRFMAKPVGMKHIAGLVDELRLKKR